MNNNQLITIILILLVLLYSIKYYSKHNKNTNKEPFKTLQQQQQQSSILQQSSNLYDNKLEIMYYLKVKEDLQNRNLLDLLDVDKTHNIPNETITVQYYPKTKENPNKTIMYNKFPVNIIYYPENKKNKVDGTYLALFNDGALYKKSNLMKSNWEGPLVNSYFYDSSKENYIFMRNINLDKNGKLLAVGYDGNIYIKSSSNDPSNVEETEFNMNYNKTQPYKNDWKLWNKNEGIKLLFILWNNDVKSYIGIDLAGNINLYNYNDNLKKLDLKLNITNNDEKYYRLSYDSNGYLLIINQNRELKKSKYLAKDIFNEDSAHCKVVEVDNVNGEDKNPNIIYDVIYHNDGTLFGIGSFNNNIVLLKQENIYYLSPFKTLYNIKSSSKPNEVTKKLTIEQITKYNTGFVQDAPHTISTLEEAYEKENNKDLQKFKKFCSEQYTDNYINVDMLNKINEFQHKIENLKNIKDNLLNLDELDKRPIQ